MAIEAATYISDLVATNPTSLDQAATSDDHIRLMKAALLATVPFDGPITASVTSINRVGDLTASAQTQLNDLKTGKLNVSATAVFAQSAGGAASAAYALSATNAVSAIFATSASRAGGANSSIFATSANYAQSAGFANGAASAAYALSAAAAGSAVFATSASAATNAVSASRATSLVMTNLTNIAIAGIADTDGVVVNEGGVTKLTRFQDMGTRVTAASTTTLALTDANKLFANTGASGFTMTVPPNSSVAFGIGTEMAFVCQSTGTITLAQGAGVTIVSLGSAKIVRARCGGAYLVETAINTWSLVGDLA